MGETVVAVNRKTVALHNRQCSSCSLLTIAKGRRSPLCRVIVQHDFQDIQHNKMARRRVYNLTVSRASSTPTLSSSANANCPVAPHCLPQGSLGTTTDAAPVQLLPVCMLVTWWGVFFFFPPDHVWRHSSFKNENVERIVPCQRSQC